MSATAKQSGAVSIFVVIFAALLITIVTVSFIRIMINDQNQATNNDLSQSAYDSALSGVEDAKRALLRYQTVCATQGSAACLELRDLINSESCNVAVKSLDGGSLDPDTPIDEIPIQQSTSGSDGALDQAYTCVLVDLETDTYEGNPGKNLSDVVPLQGVGNFDRVTISWFSKEDLGDASGAAPVNLIAGNSLVSQTSWPVNRPALLRAQLMQVGPNFTLEQFDYAAGGESNGNTVFLYPSSTVSVNPTSFIARDSRRNSPTANTPQDSTSNTPLAVQCQNSLASAQYACSVTLILPPTIGSGGSLERTAYLRLTPFYNASRFELRLFNGATPVDFDGIQPEIDSTGRANDLFRRVVSRVNMAGDFPYPEAAIDLTGDFCKDFSVVDAASTPGYYAGTCTP